MKIILITLFGLLILKPCYAGKGNGNRDEEHNCVVLIRHNQIIFDDLHGHADEIVNSWKHYSVYIPEGFNDLQVLNMNGVGDGDIYTSSHGIPNESNYECRPYTDGSNEGCSISDVTAEEYFVSLNASTGGNGYQGSDLIVDWLPNTTQILNESDNMRGFGWAGILQQQGTMYHYMIDVPEGVAELNITTSEGTGNADLYLLSGLDETISTDHFDKKSTQLGNSEEINYQQVTPGKYTIGVYAKESFENVHLRVRYQQLSLGDSAPALSFPRYDNPSIIHDNESYSLSSPDDEVYFIDVPENYGWLNIDLEHIYGDIDLYVSKNRRPTTADYDCRSWNSGTMVDENGDGVVDDDGFGYDRVTKEYCNLVVNEPGRYYILLAQYKNRKSSLATLNAKYYWIESKNDATNTGISAPVIDTCDEPNPQTVSSLTMADDAYLIDSLTTNLCLPPENNVIGIQNYAIEIPKNINSITIKTDHGILANDIIDLDLFVSSNFSGWPAYCDTNNVIPMQPSMCNYQFSSTDFDNNECIHLSTEDISGEYAYLSIVGPHNGATLNIRYDDETSCNINHSPIEGIKLIKDLEFGEEDKEIRRCIIHNYNIYQKVSDVTSLNCEGYVMSGINLSDTNFELLGHFQNLSILNLHDTNITDSSISSLPLLPSLQVLILDNNNIHNLNGLENLSNLTELHLYGNLIEDISQIVKLTNLHTLELESNNIRSLDGIETLLKLKTVNLRNNIIEDLSSINSLTSLEMLYVENNRLSNLAYCNDLLLIQLNNPDINLKYDSGVCGLSINDVDENDDTDLDGIKNYQDNCAFVANTNQRDTNNNGFGNRCDGDLDRDGDIDWDDVNFAYWFLGTLGDDNYNPDADIGGNNIVDSYDVDLIRYMMYSTGVPGPSAVGDLTPNAAPTISGTAVSYALTNVEYNFKPVAEDYDGDILSFSISNKPSWAQFNTSTGRLVGTPESVGNDSDIVITVTDGRESASLAPFAITVTNLNSENDTDGDGIANNIDNCTFVANANQRDTNGNGFGNWCDGDLDEDGVIDWDDINRSSWYKGDGNYNPDADINGDDIVDSIDTGLIKQMMNGAGVPGPSAIASSM